MQKENSEDYKNNKKSLNRLETVNNHMSVNVKKKKMQPITNVWESMGMDKYLSERGV
jgi:hypothetical protein